MAKKLVTVVNNYLHIQTFPVGNKLGTRLIPGPNQIREETWAAIVKWVKERAKGEDASMLDKMIVGPAIEEAVVPAPTTAELLAAEREAVVEASEKAIAPALKGPKSSKRKAAGAEPDAFDIG